MSNQRTFILAVATIILTAVLQPARANTKASKGGNEGSQEAKVTQVMSKLLPDFPGKEVVVLTVTYPPGTSGAVHRHNAHAFVYVLEGSVVMAVNGGSPIRLTPGQTFYEGPNDIHTIGRNASKTKPAKFLAFFIKDKDAPITVPVK